MLRRTFQCCKHCDGGCHRHGVEDGKATAETVLWSEDDAGNRIMAESAVALSGGNCGSLTGFNPDFCPLATAPLPTKDGHVRQASVRERGSILLSHPLLIQLNYVDGAGACQGSSSFMTVGRQRGADAVAVRRRLSTVVAAECAGAYFLGMMK